VIRKDFVVSEKDVAYVAELAHLELTEQERARMLKDLNAILGYVDRLNQLDTTSVAPMAQVLSGSGGEDLKRLGNAMRSDEPHPCMPREDALGNAPNSDGVFFKVPKVIER